MLASAGWKTFLGAFACLLLAANADAALVELTNVSSLTAGLRYACVVTSSGAALCWGANDQGQLGIGTTSDRPAAGDVAGLSSGVLAISASKGGAHTCAITNSGGVKCWGANIFGQLGDGSTTQRLTPVDVLGLPGPAIAVKAGARHTCALLATSAVKCWGNNDYGQLGDGTTTQSSVPVDVVGLTGVASISAGPLHTCVVTNAGAAECWGENGDGQLGNGTNSGMETAPVPVSSLSSGVAAISAGGAPSFGLAASEHTCAITISGGVKCWGSNWSGELGDGSTTSHLTPFDVLGLTSGTASISTGGRIVHLDFSIYGGVAQSCAVTVGGGAKCWGDNRCGEVGDGGLLGPCTLLEPPPQPGYTNQYNAPTDVVGLSSGVAAIAAGGGFTCALMAAGTVKCWGSNDGGALGNGLPYGYSGTFGSGSPVSVLTGTLPQSITFGATPAIPVGGMETISATGGGSENPIVFTSLSPAICSVSGATVSGIAQGRCTIAANQAGNAYYDDAAQATHDIRIGDRIAQTITFGTPPSLVVGGDGILSATASSGLTPVVFSSNTPSVCSVSNQVVVTGLAQGTCIIAADQAGDEFYAAIEATESFPVAATGPVSHALLVSKAGNGTGTLSSSPAGIDCGATCATTFAAGTSVTLTPTPDSGFVFAGWSGACTGFTACTLSMDGVKDVTATFAVAVSIPRLVAIATRGIVLTGNQVMIGGFIIGGASNKTVIVRARGPSLRSAGITDALANPVLQLVLSDGSVITNDDWGSAPNAAAVSASGYAPTDPHESAIMATLPPGGYTAIISGVGGTTGVGLVEVYELDHPEYPLVGIATRGEVLGGNDVLIGGFIIQGDGPQTVIVRARGPSLAAQGVANPLADPILQLISSDGTVVTNYNWTSAPNAAQIQASGFAPGDPRESAILTTLSPGAYTAIVTGGGTVGTAIVEVYRQ